MGACKKILREIIDKIHSDQIHSDLTTTPQERSCANPYNMTTFLTTVLTTKCKKSICNY